MNNLKESFTVYIMKLITTKLYDNNIENDDYMSRYTYVIVRYDVQKSRIINLLLTSIA